MRKLKVEVSWSGHNYNGGWGMPGIGAVAATAKTLAQMEQQFVSALQFHLEGMAEDGDPIPSWLAEGNYQIEFELNTAALIRYAEEFTTMAAISRASGINAKQLSHYANGTKEPRPWQRERILSGLHKIGQACLEMR